MNSASDGPFAGIVPEIADLPFAEWRQEITGPRGLGYTISVCAPPEKATLSSGFPTIFLTDADIMFGAARDFLRLAMLDGSMPPAALVGIGYRAETLAEWDERREWDFTIARPEDEQSEYDKALPFTRGGAHEFLEFLETTVRDMVTSRTPIDDKHVGLAGYSLGGAFTLTALSSGRSAFSAYAAGSPAIYRDGGFVRTCCLRFRPPANRSLSVYLSVGELEEFCLQSEIKSFVGNYLQVARHFREIQNDRFTVTTEMLPDEDHYTGHLTFLRNALPVLLDGPSGRAARRARRRPRGLSPHRSDLR